MRGGYGGGYRGGYGGGIGFPFLIPFCGFGGGGLFGFLILMALVGVVVNGLRGATGFFHDGIKLIYSWRNSRGISVSLRRSILAPRALSFCSKRS